MSKLYIVPAAGEVALDHLDATVYAPVPLSKLNRLSKETRDAAISTGSSAFPVWGTRRGQDDIMVPTWESMDAGDWVLFYTDGSFPICGRIIATDHSRPVAESLWGSEGGETWEYLYLIDEIRHINAPKEIVLEALDYKPKFVPRGFIRVNRDVEGQYGSVEALLDQLSISGLQFTEIVHAALADDESKLVEAIDAMDEEVSEEALMAAVASHTSSAPEQTESIVKRAKRSRRLAGDLKALYQGHCQLCGFTFTTAAGNPYAEVAHLRPISETEKNLDVKDNVVVLCPNHHKMLDHGPLEINYDASADRLAALVNGETTSITNKHVGPGRP